MTNPDEGSIEPNPSNTPSRDRVLTTIGGIAVTETQIITPAWSEPVQGAVWTVTDLSRTQKKIPVYAIVLAIVFALACLLGLLFLLINEEETTGTVQISVSSNGKFYQAQVPAHNANTYAMVKAQVDYAQSLSGR